MFLLASNLAEMYCRVFTAVVCAMLSGAESFHLVVILLLDVSLEFERHCRAAEVR